MQDLEVLDGATGLESSVDALKEYDVKPEWREKKAAASKAVSLLGGVFKTALDRKEWPLAGASLFFLRELEDSTGPFFLGVPAQEEACSELEKHRDEISRRILDTTIVRGEHLRKAALDTRSEIPYLARERFLEEAIRMILKLFEKNEKDLTWPYQKTWSKAEACRFIAGCYLDRSRLALPKGSSVPAKKLEALSKAKEWAERSAENEKDIESLKIRIEIGLERRFYEPEISGDTVNGLIKKLFELEFVPSPSSILDWEIVDMGCAAGILRSELDENLLGLAPDKKAPIDDSYLPLLKARAAFRLFKVGPSSATKPDLMKTVADAVKALYSVPFSSPIWTETIDLLRKIKESRCVQGWQELLIYAWKVCVEREKQVPLGLHLRMYWARQLDLYDLAFHAALEAKDLKLAVEVADSLKSRPTIKWLNLERRLSGEDKEQLRKYHEVESQWALNKYLPDYQDRVKGLRKKRWMDLGERPVTDVPAGWAAVHFYIDQAQEEGKAQEGHAIILFNGDKETRLYRSFSLHRNKDGKDLWKAFEAWQSAEREMDFGRASPYLWELCSGLGQALEFLFDNSLPQNLLLIPYGFFHMVPIHAALLNDELLLQKKSCLYLPSWTLLGAKTTVRQTTKGKALFLKWESERNTFDDLFARWPEDGVANVKVKCATGHDVKKYLERGQNPDLFAILCHGKADPLNPYNSRLHLEEIPITHADLLTSGADLKGARVYLGACESDLAPSKTTLVDEHLSMAAAFLNKGAVEVAGTLWRAGDELVKEVIESALASPGKPFRELIREKQAMWWQGGFSESGLPEGGDPAVKLYFLAPFRVIGLSEVDDEPVRRDIGYPFDFPGALSRDGQG